MGSLKSRYIFLLKFQLCFLSTDNSFRLRMQENDLSHVYLRIFVDTSHCTLYENEIQLLSLSLRTRMCVCDGDGWYT